MSKTALVLSATGLVVGLLLAVISPLAGGFVGAGLLAAAGLALALQLERQVAEFRPEPEPLQAPVQADDQPQAPTPAGT